MANELNEFEPGLISPGSIADQIVSGENNRYVILTLIVAMGIVTFSILWLGGSIGNHKTVIMPIFLIIIGTVSLVYSLIKLANLLKLLFKIFLWSLGAAIVTGGISMLVIELNLYHNALHLDGIFGLTSAFLAFYCIFILLMMLITFIFRLFRAK